MVAKFADHLSLYRQKIFARAGLQLQSLVDALCEAGLVQHLVHADETPIQMLAPQLRRKHTALTYGLTECPGQPAH